MKIYLASPRGFCAGVYHAVEIVEKALQVFGPPVYILKEIVHNKHVVDRLAKQGAYSVNSMDEVPENSFLIFSAHGVPPQFHEKAKTRGLKVIDATCPLVTKVHMEARVFSKKGYEILYIGHAGHDEVIGVMAVLPSGIHLVQDIADAEKFNFPENRVPEKLIYLTQTTLSVNETQKIIDVLKKRFPQLSAPPKEDICYATTNRQSAIEALAETSDLVLVIGSQNSSNSQRLKDLAIEKGKPSYLIDSAHDIQDAWFSGIKSVGISAGASAPEDLVQELIETIQKKYGISSVEEVKTIDEDVHFALPKILQEAVSKR